MADLAFACLCVFNQHIIALARVAYGWSFCITNATAWVYALRIDTCVTRRKPKVVCTSVTRLDPTDITELAILNFANRVLTLICSAIPNKARLTCLALTNATVRNEHITTLTFVTNRGSQQVTLRTIIGLAGGIDAQVRLYI